MHHRFISGAVAFAFALVAFGPATASAQEAGFTTPGGLAQNPPNGSSSSGISTMSNGSGFYCNKSYVPIANHWNSWAIGNCLYGNSFIQTGGAVTDPFGKTWRLGYFGNIGTCGWVDVIHASLNGGVGAPECPSGYSRPISEFIYHDGNEYKIWQREVAGGQSGRLFNTTAACDEWANLRPWSSSGGLPTTIVRSIPAGTQLAVRYRTKYVAPEFSGGVNRIWYMVHHEGVGAGNGTWVFVSGRCFPGVTFPPSDRPNG